MSGITIIRTATSAKRATNQAAEPLLGTAATQWVEWVQRGGIPMAALKEVGYNVGTPLGTARSGADQVIG
jgi:hypothetical protein